MKSITLHIYTSRIPISENLNKITWDYDVVISNGYSEGVSKFYFITTHIFWTFRNNFKI